MIEIDLLPGAGKRAKRGGGPTFEFGAAFSGLSARVKDRWLATAVICGLASVLAVGALYVLQTRDGRDLSARTEKALADSTRFSSVLLNRVHLEAKRDTLLRQLNIIRAIDGDRFLWPHILDEVSKALPAYTWITDLAFTGTPQGTTNVAAAPKPAADAAKPAEGDTAKAKPIVARRAARLVTDVPLDTVHIRIQGRTVDLQALTRFWRQLEDSPFLGNVTLEKSESAVEGGMPVTDFVLNAVFTRPDSASIRRVPLSVSVK